MLACVGVSQNLAKAIGFELRIVLGLSLVATWFGLSLLECLCALVLEAGCSPLSPSLALAHSLSWFALSPELTLKLSP